MRTKKRIVNFFIWSVLLVLPFTVNGGIHKHKCYIELSGGIAFTDTGDFGHMRDNNNSAAKKRGVSVTETPFPMDFSFSIGSEYRKMTVSLETGYIVRTFKANGNIQGTTRDGNFHKWKFAAIPLLLNLEYRIFKSKKLALNIEGGGGVYFGKFSENGMLGTNYTWSEEATQIAPGIHIGTSLNYAISSNLKLIFRLRLRSVSFSSLDGKGTHSGSSTEYKGHLYFSRHIKEGPTFFSIGKDSSLKKASIDLNGAVMRLGIRLIF